jgi:sulfur relay (sulfurtransferase) DsrC/TusE family protein
MLDLAVRATSAALWPLTASWVVVAVVAAFLAKYAAVSAARALIKVISTDVMLGPKSNIIYARPVTFLVAM